MFIHKAILEVVEGGNTTITAPDENIIETIKQLATTEHETGKTGFQLQFEVLFDVVTISQLTALNIFFLQRLCKGNQESKYKLMNYSVLHVTRIF